MITGSLQKKGNMYYAVVRIPDNTGNEKQKWISTGYSISGNFKRLAQHRLQEIITDYEQQKVSYSKDLMFVDWMEKWLEQKENEIRVNTLESYIYYFNKHIVPFFKPLKLTLDAVTPQHIQDYYNKKVSEGQSANSIRKHNAIIRGALQEAMKKNFIPYNPTDRATLPRKVRFISKSYTIEQANRLLKIIDAENIKPAIILALFYGLRRSEALGLRWKDINFNLDTITIRNTVVQFKTIIESERTKSRASNRVLHIVPETKGYLLSLKQKQDENRILLGKSYDDNDHVCVWNDGKPFKPDYISQRFASLLKKYGLPKIRFHELRHTAGSILLKNGLSIKHIQEYLGHEKASTTMDIYIHLSDEGKKESAHSIGSVLEISAI
jgi:integrase